MNTKTNITIVVNNERLTSREVFRACGVTWVRYSRQNNENGYATLAEWKTWLSSNKIFDHAGMV